MKTFEEWIAFYEKKTGDKFIPHPDFKLIYFPEYGFCEYSLEKDTKMVMIYQLCGDGKFWRRVGETMARVLGWRNMGSICIRRIKPYIRFWGYRVVEKRELAPGEIQYICRDKQGRDAQCTPAWRDDKGEWAYYVTWRCG